jgi:glutamyl-tRNA reductase
MELLFIGTSHRIASVATRERFVAAVGDVPRWLAAVADTTGPVAELLVVSTCHRLEFYLVTHDPAQARARVAEWCGADVNDVAGPGEHGWCVRAGVEAAEHLCSVTAGLDSLIVGEAEIAGQVRRAATAARDAGTLGPYLEKVVAGALRASGRARSETRIGEGVLSAASAGVAMATAAFGSLANRHVLVIGAGQAGRMVLSRVARRPVGRLSVASRSLRHATEAAAHLGADVWTLDGVTTRLGDVDVIIAAVAAQAPIITADACRAAFDTVASRPRVFVDLSMPRIIDPNCAALPGVRLFSVDDLGDLARQSATRREREVPVAHAIAREEGQRAYAQVQARRRYERTRADRRSARL